MVNIRTVKRVKIVVITVIMCVTFFSNVVDAETKSYSGSKINSSYEEQIKKDILGEVGLKKADLVTEKKEVDISERLSALVPEKADIYAKSRFCSLVNTVKDNPVDFGVIIRETSTLRLGKPFVIYSAESLGTQDPIYYYPIFDKNDIILVLSVIDSEGEYTAGISTDYVSVLEELDYQENDDYIFYEDGENLYAESYDNKEKIDELSVSSEVLYENEKMNVEVFEDLSTENKVMAVVNSYSKGNIKEIAESDGMLEGAKGFSSKKGGVVRLDTSGCLVSQYNDNNCWAASVATTLRYLYYPKYRVLTARDVSKKMGKGYNQTATIYEKQTALKKYGCTYSKLRKYQISFSLISKNILAQKPVLVSAFSGKLGHAVTIIGYTTYGGINQITFHNPGTNTCTSVEYKNSGTTFSYINRKWKWERTLSSK